jgi:heme/copper-type cytochrome/quinol oxidase subunit 2
MSGYLSALVLFLVACSAWAQDEGVGGPPAETVALIWVAVFGFIFVGMIVGFFLYVWWRERRSKNGDE